MQKYAGVQNIMLGKRSYTQKSTLRVGSAKRQMLRLSWNHKRFAGSGQRKQWAEKAFSTDIRGGRIESLVESASDVTAVLGKCWATQGGAPTRRLPQRGLSLFKKGKSWDRHAQALTGTSQEVHHDLDSKVEADLKHTHLETVN